MAGPVASLQIDVHPLLKELLLRLATNDLKYRSWDGVGLLAGFGRVSGSGLVVVWPWGFWVFWVLGLPLLEF